MSLRKATTFAFVLALLAHSAYGAAESVDQQAVKTFKGYVTELMSRYKAEKHVRVEATPICGTLDAPGFVKAAYKVSSDYKIDVRMTDSLISPYIGIVEFQWKEQYSDCENSPEQAAAQKNLSHLSHPDSLKYRYTYAFQDGKWVPADREIGSLNSTATEVEWESCKEEARQLAATKFKLDFGCSVPEPKQK